MKEPNLIKSPGAQLVFKAIAVILITAFLLIPVTMIESLVYERATNYEKVAEEISHSWAGNQRVTGPFLEVPFKEEFKKTEKITISEGNTQTVKNLPIVMMFSPSNLKANLKTIPMEKYRGIYKYIVYTSEIELSGDFDDIKNQEMEVDGQKVLAEHLDFSKAKIHIELSDIKGLSSKTKVNWQGKELNFSSDKVSSGVVANLNIDSSAAMTFSAKLITKGSRSLILVPLGCNTSTTMTTDWASPKYFGNFLPDSSSIKNNKFESRWDVAKIANPLPSYWTSNSGLEIGDNFIGIELIEQVDKYQQTTRSIKYSILFILLSFIALFFTELISKKKSHIIDYVLIGFAIVLFYSILLSLTEHLSFGLSYLIASIAIIGLNSIFASSVFKSTKTGLLMLAIWSGLFGYLYFVLQLEDYALLVGNAGLFVILALVMFFSRKIKLNHGIQISKSDKGDLL